MFLFDGPEDAAATVLLAHGAGAPMDSPAMSAAARALAETGLRVARFEFSYMAARREGGPAKPPPRAETLVPAYRAVVAALDARGPLFIGGKSMGGRVASMAVDELRAEERVAGLLCLGYPFHPPGRPGSPRTAHLAQMRAPALICQGTRDPFGTREEVSGYDLSPSIEVFWLEDGDHDLRPRKAVTGRTAADHQRAVAARARAWIASLS